MTRPWKGLPRGQQILALPDQGDMRFNWIHVRLDALDADEMRDLVEEAWSRVVPLHVAEEYGAQGYR
jgi:hypothetical protein